MHLARVRARRARHGSDGFRNSADRGSTRCKNGRHDGSLIVRGPDSDADRKNFASLLSDSTDRRLAGLAQTTLRGAEPGMSALSA